MYTIESRLCRMSDVTVDSPTTAAIQRAKQRLAKQHHTLRVMWLDQTQYQDWADALTVPLPGLASDILKHLCSTAAAPYRVGNTINNDRKDHAITLIRAANAAACPNDATEARAWVVPLLELLGEQAAEEYGLIKDALASHQPLLTPPKPSAPTETPVGGGPAPAPEHRENAEQKGVRLMSEYMEQATRIGFHYMSIEPPYRLCQKSILALPGRIGGCIMLPAYSVLQSNGRAGDPYPGMETDVTFLAVLNALQLRYCGVVPEGVVLTAEDALSTRLLVAPEEGGEPEERPCDLDPSTLRMLDAKLQYPVACIRDSQAKAAACSSIWGSIQTAMASVGQHSINHAFHRGVLNSEAIREAMSLVRGQASTSVSTSQPPGSGRKPPKAPKTSPAGGGNGKGATPSGSTDWPRGQCFDFCKRGECAHTGKVGASDCAKYGHDPSNKGKYPNAVLPAKRS